MRKILIAILVLVLSGGLHGQSLPPVELTDVYTGSATTFDQAFGKGRVTLICFWGTWCAHGKRQIQTIRRNMAAWKKQADFDFAAIAVDQQQMEQLVRPYAAAQHWNFAAYIDPLNGLKQALHFNGLPYNIIIDQHGRIVYAHGGHEDGKAILATLRQLSGRK